MDQNPHRLGLFFLQILPCRQFLTQSRTFVGMGHSGWGRPEPWDLRFPQDLPSGTPGRARPILLPRCSRAQFIMVTVAIPLVPRSIPPKLGIAAAGFCRVSRVTIGAVGEVATSRHVVLAAGRVGGKENFATCAPGSLFAPHASWARYHPYVVAIHDTSMLPLLLQGSYAADTAEPRAHSR